MSTHEPNTAPTVEATPKPAQQLADAWDNAISTRAHVAAGNAMAAELRRLDADNAAIAALAAPQPAQCQCPYTDEDDSKREAWIEGYEAAQGTPQALQPLTNPEPLYELARVCFDAGIKHGQGAKNCWFSDGKAMSIISSIMKGPA